MASNIADDGFDAEKAADEIREASLQYLLTSIKLDGYDDDDDDDDDVYFLTNQWCWEFTLFVYQLYHT